MASKRETQLRKVFPEATEKVLKDYKCALYLDLHHPGRLFITATQLYFFSTKNIQAPLPNPLAVVSTFKDLKSISKSGMDGIIIEKGDEEILLDSFQFRNETYDVLYRSFLSAGHKGQPAVDAKKEEAVPLDMEVKGMMTRPIDVLPFFNDLGLLSQHYTIRKEGQVIFNGQATKKLSKLERLKVLLVTLAQQLHTGGDEKWIETLEKGFDVYFEKAEDEKVKYSINPPTAIEFIKKHFGDNSKVVQCLKACIHPITAAIIRLKDSLTSFFPTKDKSWEVVVDINKELLVVRHCRHEQCIHGQFEVQWKMTLTFDGDVKDLQDVEMNVSDLIFDGDTKEQTRYQLQQLLKDYMHSKVLPSFADLSNQKLGEIPDNILQMSHMQTLYLHFNQIAKIPQGITQLNNLQVLYMNQNMLAEFPTVVCNIQGLRELHLGRNRIATIPADIGKMQELRELSLSYNLLTGDLPKELFTLGNLRKLYLHNNYLETVPKEIANLPNLKTLQIHNNQKMTGKLKEFGPEDSEDLLKYLKEETK